MKGITSTFCAVAMVVGLTIGGTASADNHIAEADQPKWDFGLFGGYHFTSEKNELGVADVDPVDSFDDSWGVGLRLGYAFMEIVSAEVSAVTSR